LAAKKLQIRPGNREDTLLAVALKNIEFLELAVSAATSVAPKARASALKPAPVER
jgi:hypothetical protein